MEQGVDTWCLVARITLLRDALQRIVGDERYSD
jgi:hypothetical protein